jgi:hypothetical protein
LIAKHQGRDPRETSRHFSDRRQAREHDRGRNIVHYTLSVFFVFADQDTGKSQRRLISEYVLTGGAGVLITSAVIFAVVDLAGLPPFVGKGVAVVITFVVVYIMRAGYVFNGGRPDVDAIVAAPEPMASGR